MNSWFPGLLGWRGWGRGGWGGGAACKVLLCWETTATGLLCFGGIETTVGVQNGEAGAQTSALQTHGTLPTGRGGGGSVKTQSEVSD